MNTFTGAAPGCDTRVDDDISVSISRRASGPQHQTTTRTVQFASRNGWGGGGFETLLTPYTTVVNQNTTGHNTSASVDGHRSRLAKLKPQKTGNKFVLADWQWKIATAALSVFCFAAAVAVLSLYQNRPISDWNFVLDTSLNSLVATLSTFLAHVRLRPHSVYLLFQAWMFLLVRQIHRWTRKCKAQC
jgi:hypothetical protein